MIRTFFKQILQDFEGQFSSKRAVTIASFFVMLIAIMCNLFLGLKVEQFEFDAFAYIVVAGLGFTTAEPVANAMSKRLTKAVGVDEDGRG